MRRFARRSAPASSTANFAVTHDAKAAIAVGRLQLLSVDHPPAPTRLGDEAKADLAQLGHRRRLFNPCKYRTLVENCIRGRSNVTAFFA